MNKADFARFHAWFRDKMWTLWDAKNKDYTGDAEDSFANFARSVPMGISVEQAIASRMGDKFGRITTYVKTGFLHVKEENIENECLDLANFAVALAAHYKHQKDLVKPREPAAIP